MLPLSYSSSSLLINCEERYAHYKIKKTPIDSDASRDTSAFSLGSAFHKVLEDTMHTRLDIDKNVTEACREHKVMEKSLVKAMVEVYLDMHELSGLECVFCEMEIKDQYLIGYIDAVLKDITGKWWITDLKTASRFSTDNANRLPRDTQLNLYAHFAPRVAEALDLDLDKFSGVRYRTTTKAKLKQKKTESTEEYVERLKSGITSYDISIPKENMDVEGTWERHISNFNRAKELFEGATPKRNLTYCSSYFRPCEYWSQCHGVNFTEPKGFTIKTGQTYREELLLDEEI